MKLILKNFKIHSSKTFDFPKWGLVLLSGENDVGKSTLIKAFCFVLFGKTKTPCSYESRSCSVELITEQYHITRGAGVGAFFTVKDTTSGVTHKDPEAQRIVDTLVGVSYEEFRLCSYFKGSGCDNSIISMKPANKLAFINSLLGSAREKTEKVRMLVCEKVEELGKCNSQKRDIEQEKSWLIKGIPQDQQHPPEIPNIPKPILSEIQQLQDNISKRKELEQKSKPLLEKVALLTQEINNLTAIQEDVSTSTIPAKDLEQKEYQRLELIRKEVENDGILKLEERRLELAEKLSVLSSDLKKPEVSLDELKIMKEEQLLFDIISKYNIETSNNVTTCSDVLGLLAKKYSCPSCNAILSCGESDKLVLVSKPPVKKAPPKKKSTKTVAKPKEDVVLKEQPVLHVHDNDLVVLEGLPSTTRSCDHGGIDKINSIVGDWETYEISLKKVASIQMKLEKLQSQYTTNVTNACYKEQILDLDVIIKEQQKLRKRLVEIKRDLIIKNKSLVTFEEKLSSLGLATSTAESNQKLLEAQAAMGLWKSYESSKKDFDNFTKGKLRLDELNLLLDSVTKRQQELEINIKGLRGVEESIKEAEIIHSSRILDSMSDASSVHISNLIGDYLKCVLNCERMLSNKTTKLEIATEVFKNDKRIPYKDLGDGMKQLCDLAYILGTNDVLNGNFIFLDESFNNFHVNLNKKAMEYLKMYSENNKKLVVVIAHEGIKGMFDEVLEL